MVNLEDIKPIIPQRVLDSLSCNGVLPGSECEGETRTVPGRQCDPPSEYSMPIERGGVMDKNSIW